MKKIAFCFLIYDYINHEELWYKFFQQADKNKYTIYIHYKDDKELKYLNEYKLSSCINTSYAHVSLLHAHNLLFKTAYKDTDNYKFINLSQACVPLKSFDYIYDFLTKDNYGHFNIAEREKCFPRCERLTNFIPKEFINKSYNWFILNRNLVSRVTSMSHESINLLYEDMYAPEEIYFITYIFSHNLQDEIITTQNLSNDATTFTNWHDMTHYKYVVDYKLKNYSLIEEEELKYLIKQSKCLFGRKFNPECITVKDDKKLKKLSDGIMDIINDS